MRRDKNLAETRRYKEQEPREPLVCPLCSSIYTKHSWHWDEKELEALTETGAPLKLCPGCRKLETDSVDGMVELNGAFVKDHRREIVGLIKNVLNKKSGHDVNARIYSLEADSDHMFLQTTEMALAEQIGKALHNAFSGDLNIQWLEGEKFVRVNWARQ